MAFIRRKMVKGIAYAYKVENRKVNGKVKQTVLEYLGRADKIRKNL